MMQFSPNALAQALPLVMMFGIIYLFLILPMQRQKKQQKEMLEGLKAGDEVQTAGGIVGAITTITDNTLVIRVKPDGVKLTVARAAVSAKLSD
jgi:preprotein translocase subunit YajC